MLGRGGAPPIQPAVDYNKKPIRIFRGLIQPVYNLNQHKTKEWRSRHKTRNNSWSLGTSGLHYSYTLGVEGGHTRKIICAKENELGSSSSDWRVDDPFHVLFR